MKALLHLAAALALAAGFAVANAAPTIVGNTPDQARTWAYCDSVVRTAKDTIKPVYLVQGVTTRGEMDSVIQAWRNGGAAPAFRRMQGVRIFNEAGCTAQMITLDIFHADGTSANNKFEINCQYVLEIPLEADSIHFTAASVGNDMNICVW